MTQNNNTKKKLESATSKEERAAIIADLPYESGFAKPPEHSQFKKGNSYHRRRKPKRGADKPRLLEEYTKTVAHRLAQRRVPVKLNGKTVYMPSIDAALLTILTKGLAGDTRCLFKYVDFVGLIESERRQETIDDVMAAMKYKRYAEEARAKAKAEGRPEPDFELEPNNIEVNPALGDVRATGPLTKEEKQERADWKKMKKGVEEDLAACKKQLEENPNEPSVLKEIAQLEHLLTKINKVLA